MSSILLENSSLPMKVQSILLKFHGNLSHWAKRDTQRRFHLIECVAESLVTHIHIWTWESSVAVLAHIACWHTQRETYRGFQLCSDTVGHTFLLDMTNYVYVKDTTKKLLQFDAVEQAKMFVDALRAASQ